MCLLLTPNILFFFSAFSSFLSQKQITGETGHLLIQFAGDPLEAVLLGLEAAEKVFGADTNSLGYKVPRGCGVIQGDGISIEVLDNILQAVMAKDYSAQVLSRLPNKPDIKLILMQSSVSHKAEFDVELSLIETKRIQKSLLHNRSL